VGLSVKPKLYQGETRTVKTGRGVRQRCCLSLILFNLNSEYFPKEPHEGFGDFQIEGQVIRTVIYADYLVLLAKEATVLQGIIERLNEYVRFYGMEINVKKTKVMGISRQPSPIQIMIHQKDSQRMWHISAICVA
jgi:hypothetical protein